MDSSKNLLFSFEDFIPVYPKQDDPEIQYKINTKKEFVEVSGEPVEPKPTPGELYRHQKAFKRYLIHSDRILNIQSTGTGKTCAMVAVAEYYKRYKEKEHINKVFVLVNGPSVQAEFIRQIACDCTNKEYLTENVTDPGKDPRYRRQALSREISKWYKIMTYGEMVKLVQSVGLDEEKIESEFSGSIFLVDEAHYLNEKRKVKQAKDDFGEGVEDVAKQYQVLWKLFHNVKRSKIILSTATPMINDVKEIATLMNLLLPIDQQMPLSWDYNKVSLSQLEPFFRGKVSYVRGLDTGVNLEFQGVKLKQKYVVESAPENASVEFLSSKCDLNGNIIYEPEQPKIALEMKEYDSQTFVYPLYMDEFQEKAYKKSVNTNTVARYSEIQASSLVFPDGSYGEDFTKKKKEIKGASKYINVTGTDTYELTKEFKSKVKPLSELKKLSCKYGFILENELKAVKDRLDGKIVGTSFCYSELVTGGGLIILSKILEEYGFEKFNETTSVFYSSKTSNKEFCSGGADQEKSIRLSFLKKPRFGIISASMSIEQRETLIELFNSAENANGDYIQIMLVSISGREGINVFNVLRGYMIDPGWHSAGLNQALARFVRSTSHLNILKLIRGQMEARGEDSSQARVDVKVYKLSALMSEKELDNYTVVANNYTDDFVVGRSVDLDIYSTIENKDIKIKRIMRILKQCAFDCPIHYKRNVYENDVDGSERCDYDKCKYVCYPSELTNDIEPDLVDYETFDILYSDTLVDECKKEIIRILSKRNSISLDDLFIHPDIRPIYKEKYVIMAIDKIIKERKTIRNKFGFTSFINIDRNTLFTQAEFPNYDNININSGNSSLNIYKDVLIGYKKNDLENITSDFSLDSDKELLNRINELSNPLKKDYDEFNVYFDKLTKKTKIEFLETAIINKYVNKNASEIEEAILVKFKNYYLISNEPLKDIMNIKAYLETSNTRRGRARKITPCPKIDYDLLGGMNGADNDTEIVYIHKAESSLSDSNAFKANAQFFNPDQIKIFKPSEGTETFRLVLDYECQAYKNIIRLENENKIKALAKDYKYIGTLLDGKDFRIIVTENLKFDMVDKRSTSKGVVCTSFGNKIDLIEILLESNYMIPEVEEINVKLKTKNDCIETLIENYKVDRTQESLSKYTYDELIFIIKWFVYGNKNKLCDNILNLFKEENRILFD